MKKLKYVMIGVVSTITGIVIAEAIYRSYVDKLIKCSMEEGIYEEE